MHEIVTAMASSWPELSLKLFLQCAQCADHLNSGFAYDFVSQAFIIFEDEPLPGLGDRVTVTD